MKPTAHIQKSAWTRDRYWVHLYMGSRLVRRAMAGSFAQAYNVAATWIGRR